MLYYGILSGPWSNMMKLWSLSSPSLTQETFIQPKHYKLLGSSIMWKSSTPIKTLWSTKQRYLRLTQLLLPTAPDVQSTTLNKAAGLQINWSHTTLRPILQHSLQRPNWHQHRSEHPSPRGFKCFILFKASSMMPTPLLARAPLWSIVLKWSIMYNWYLKRKRNATVTQDMKAATPAWVEIISGGSSGLQQRVASQESTSKTLVWREK